jgi:outer membrane lipoprotein-sorting protein
MRNAILTGLLALAVLAPFTGAAEEPTLDAVAEQIAAAWEKVNSYTAKMTAEGNIPMGPLSVTTAASGSVEFMIVDEIPRFRMEIVNKMGGNMPLLGGGMEQKALSVFNGEIVYSEMEAMGRKKYTKATPKADDERSPVGGRSMVEKIRKRGEVRLLPDEQVNGVDSYVLELKPDKAGRQEGPIKPELIRFYVAKDSGIQVRSILMDADGDPVLTTNYSDITVNPELDPKRFDYTPPPGVEVIDMGDGTKPLKLF